MKFTTLIRRRKSSYRWRSFSVGGLTRQVAVILDMSERWICQISISEYLELVRTHGMRRRIDESSTTLHAVAAAPTEKNVIDAVPLEEYGRFDEVLLEHVGFAGRRIEIRCELLDAHVVVL